MDVGGDQDGFQGGGLPNFPNLQTYSPWYTTTPKLASSNNFELGQTHQNYENYNQGGYIPSNVLGGSSSLSRGISSSHEIGGVALPSLPLVHSSNIDNMFPNGGQHFYNWNQMSNYPNIDFNNEVISSPPEISRGGSKNSTKGQWTQEEDSKLFDLVMEHGAKNWALIAESMEGRAGKQCRERWYNHVRPDIKTDDWSENEERILIEAHQKMGNKWAEIAKMIPGRTENAIKNHWNAAKRKKTLRHRRSKKNESNNGGPKSTVLRDYIRGTGSTSANLQPTSSRNVTPGNFTAISTDELSNEFENLFHDDDEFDFMKNIFGNSGSTVPQPNITTSNEPLVQLLEPPPSLNMNSFAFNENSQYGFSSPSIPLDGSSSNVYRNRNSQTDAQFSSDAYFPYLPDGSTRFPNSTNVVYDYRDMNMGLAFNFQGGGDSSDAFSSQ